MEKQQVITLLESQLAAGTITPAELIAVANGAAPATTPAAVSTEANSKHIVYALYAIGAVIAIAGISILIGQNWEDIGFAGRIAVTAGISFVTYLVALLLNKPEHRVVSQVLFTISAALAPLGAYVFLAEAGSDFGWVVQMEVAGALAVIYGAALWVSKRPILVLLTIAYVTWGYYAYILNMIAFNSLFADDTLRWATLLIGIAYVCVGYGYQTLKGTQDGAEQRAVTGVLYSLGLLAILGATSTFGGVFDFYFIAILFAAFYASVFLKSRNMLILSAIFLVVHLIKLTSLYFADSIGWPIALIGVGFLVIGVGYGTFYVNRHYINAK